MHSVAFTAFVAVRFPCIDRDETIDFRELANLFGDQSENHEDNSYTKHLAVDSMRIDVAVSYSRDCNDQEVKHVVELVFIFGDPFHQFRYGSIHLTVFGFELIHLADVLVFDCQH